MQVVEVKIEQLGTLSPLPAHVRKRWEGEMTLKRSNSNSSSSSGRSEEEGSQEQQPSLASLNTKLERAEEKRKVAILVSHEPTTKFLPGL